MATGDIFQINSGGYFLEGCDASLGNPQAYLNILFSETEKQKWTQDSLPNNLNYNQAYKMNVLFAE